MPRPGDMDVLARDDAVGHRRRRRPPAGRVTRRRSPRSAWSPRCAPSLRELDGDASLAGRRVAVQGVGHVGAHLVADCSCGAGASVVVADVNATRAEAVAASTARRGRRRRRDPRGRSATCSRPCALGGALDDRTVAAAALPRRVRCGEQPARRRLRRRPARERGDPLRARLRRQRRRRSSTSPRSSSGTRATARSRAPSGIEDTMAEVFARARARQSRRAAARRDGDMARERIETRGRRAALAPRATRRRGPTASRSRLAVRPDACGA